MIVLTHVLGYVCATTRGVVHAAKPRLRAKGRKTIDTACGRRGRLVAVWTHDGYAMTVPWAPSVRAAGKWGLTRCRECFELTGRPRPAVYPWEVQSCAS